LDRRDARTTIIRKPSGEPIFDVGSEMRLTAQLWLDISVELDFHKRPLLRVQLSYVPQELD